MAKKGRLADELAGALWAYRSSPRRPTDEAPFSLVHGVESVILVQHGVQTIMAVYAHGNEDSNNQVLCESLNLIEKKIEHALIIMSQYQQSIARYSSKNLCPRNFDVGDLVL